MSTEARDDPNLLTERALSGTQHNTEDSEVLCVSEDTTGTERQIGSSLVPGIEMTQSGQVVPSTAKGRPTSGCWRDKSTPKDGWVWESCIDLGEYPGARCEMCLREHPRFIHIINDEQGGTKRVGRICAAWMCDGDKRPKETERKMKNRLDRLETRDREYQKSYG